GRAVQSEHAVGVEQLADRGDFMGGRAVQSKDERCAEGGEVAAKDVRYRLAVVALCDDPGSPEGDAAVGSDEGIPARAAAMPAEFHGIEAAQDARRDDRHA